MVKDDYEKAKECAMKGHYSLSDEFFLKAYANAQELYETYDHAMFLDEEIKLLKEILDEFEIL